ncbi:hypothetical protein EON63_16935, partial [archaeon]
MSTELTREQLLEYVKKQRVKIKKLETDLQTAQQASSTTDTSVSTQHTVELAERDARIAQLLGKLQEREEVVSALEREMSELKTDLERYATKHEELTKISLQYEDTVGLNKQLEDTIARLKTEFSAQISLVSQELKDSKARLAEQISWREECDKLKIDLEQKVKDMARLEQEA